MKKLTVFLLNLLVLSLPTAFGQKPVIELTFNAKYYNQYVPLDSIYIENLTQGGDTILFAPDTVLVLDYTVGVTTNPSSNAGFRVSQNRPNPFAEQTIISIFLPLADHLQVSVVNLLGQKVAFFERSLDAGNHSFVFYPGSEKYYILSATAIGLTKAIKMVSLNNHSGKSCSLNYQGKVETSDGYKSIQETNNFGYSLGDQLRFIGYTKTPALINGSDVIEDAPMVNQTYTFEIIEGIPCPGTPIITYEGQIYNTVQIGDQCWFKENLNVGTMIPGSQEMADNGIIEKYCYEDDPANCATYGGSYQWNEMMQYTTQQGTQGICPNGWHIPTDAECTVLTDFLGGWYVAGGKMKATGTIEAGTGLWYAPNTGATNSTGFTAIPGGFRNIDGSFYGLGNFSYFWTSTEYSTDNAWHRGMQHANASVQWGDDSKSYGTISRCIKDQEQTCPGTPTVTYEGQIYNTVQIGEQCWLKENLNVGIMINTSQDQTDNGVIEKFCYDDDLANCDTYGGLYQWDEMMQYSIAQGTQGICPENWHLPSEAEWCTLTIFIDPTVDCNAEGLSGTDAGTKMKSTTGWNSGGNGTNVSGFNALPGGFFVNGGVGGYFEGIAASGKFLTSSEYTIGGGKLIRGLYNYSAGIDRMTVTNLDGLSVRCVKNEGSATIPTVTTAAISGITQTTATGGGEVTDDGGAEIQIRGVCWSTSQNPTFADNHTYNGTGMGAFVSELTGLASNTPYFVRAYAINSAGYAYGNEVTFTTLSSGFNCGDVVNYEGQNYNTILIGTQCWFKENLNIGTMINVSQNQTNNGIIEKYCYDNSSSNCATRGGLYQWNEMMQYTTTQGAQGICPENWHLPTDAEWIILTDYVSSQPENLCNSNTNYIAKSLAATTNWNTSSSTCAIGNNLSTNNATGFTALPGGLRWPDGLFSGLNSDGNWWSSTQHPDPAYSISRWLFYQQPTVNGAGSQKTYGFSVRCMRNN